MEIQNSKFKIGLNGYFLSRPYTGFGVYTIGLLKALGKIADPEQFEFIVFTPEKTNFKFGGPIKVVVVPERQSLGASLAKVVWEQWDIISVARKYKVDLLHHLYPSTAVFSRGIYQIASIHDATPWHFKEHNFGLKIKLLRRFMTWSNRKAKLVISVSNYGKDDVSLIYKIPKEKIQVIYNGISSIFRQSVTKSGIEQVKRKYHLKNPYIFYVGGFEVHKNVRRLIESYAQSAPTIAQDLVIAGGVFSKAKLEVYKDFFAVPKIAKKNNLENRIKQIGVVPDEDLPALYQGADLFIMLSLAEGFNLPLVQALACKVPSIASNILATEEIVGNSAYLVDPTDTAEIARAIVKVLSDKKLQESLVARGVERQSQFTWEQAGERLITIYSQIVGKDI